jgi:anaerobic magnesium-protoporphyrin IX monomethyl ester cyclase
MTAISLPLAASMPLAPVAKRGNRILFVAREEVIEPLGIHYLAGLAGTRGWDVEVCLIRNSDFEPLYKLVSDYKPDLVGFTIWTGYHLQAFSACDRVREMGTKVVIGGPHATYFTDECAKHSDFVVKGEGFRLLRKILDGELSPGTHFDKERVAEGFPMPNREPIYKRYGALAASPIKSIIATLGCPFKCTYCYAPVWNKMYGGFKLNNRPVEDIVREGCEIRDRWPAKMIYFQDDIFGFDTKWLAEFAREWREKVGLPWHCQIRLELTHDEHRLDLFREGGCTGITLAIESGNAFLRKFVLHRGMKDELIVEGIRKIQARGLTLRTEQILAVPMSDIKTDLETLELNCRLKPQMGWTSILAPYGGTAMGTIARNFGLYKGNNDDLKETFFDRSILRHPADARALLEEVVPKFNKSADMNPNPLEQMFAERIDEQSAEVVYRAEGEQEQKLGKIRYLSDKANDRYCDQTVMLQRLFNWLTLVPEGHKLGAKIVEQPKENWTWKKIGNLTNSHLHRLGGFRFEKCLYVLASRLVGRTGSGLPLPLPPVIRDNPYYFCFFPSGDELAQKVVQEGLFTDAADQKKSFDRLATLARHQLFNTSLYKIVEADAPIAA